MLPAVGTYTVQVQGHAIASDNSKVIVVPTLTHTFMVGPVSAQFVPVVDPVTPLTAVRAEFDIVGPDGQPVEIATGGQVAMQAILYPSGSDPTKGTELTMQRQQGARFVASQTVMGLSAGEYRVKTHGRLETEDGKQQDLWDSDEVAFTVYRLGSRLVSPTTTQQPFRLVDVEYELADVNGRPVNVDPTFEVHLRLHIASSPSLSKTVEMTPTGNGHFRAQLFLAEGPATYQLGAEGWMVVNGKRQDLFWATQDEIRIDSLRVDLIEPAPGECPPERTLVQLQFELRSGSGGLYDMSPQYPIDLKSSAAYKDGGSPQPLALSVSSPGRLVASLIPDRWGKWQAHIEGTVTDPTGNVIPALNADSEFCVLDVVPVSLTIAAPRSGEELPLRLGPRAWPFIPDRPAPVEFQVRFVNVENGTDIAINRFAPREPSGLLAPALYYGPQNQGVPGSLAFAVHPDNPAWVVARSDVLTREGTYTFTVAARADSPLNEGFVWAAGASDALQISFTRRDTLRAVGILLSVAQLALAVTLLALAIFLVWLFTDPIKGQLQFFVPGTADSLGNIPLPRRRWATIREARIPDKVRRMARVYGLQVMKKNGKLHVTWKEGSAEIEPGRTKGVGKAQAKWAAPAPSRRFPPSSQRSSRSRRMPPP